MNRAFLSAEWRHIAMVSYEIDPAVLLPLVPRGTELDGWDGRTLVSMVGFRFLNTRVMGLSIPFHRNFEEINLRFYVRRKAAGEWRRGVVFIKEIVPRAAIALSARLFYNENYVALPTSHAISGGAAAVKSARYTWTFRGAKCCLEVVTRGDPEPLAEGSREEFIAQHYWGYSTQRDGGTVEYEVEHPPWRVWQCESGHLDGDVEALYGVAFAEALRAPPASAFLAEGSAVAVHRGRRVA